MWYHQALKQNDALYASLLIYFSRFLTNKNDHTVIFLWLAKQKSRLNLLPHKQSSGCPPSHGDKEDRLLLHANLFNSKG